MAAARTLTQRLTIGMWILSAISCAIAAGLSTWLILRNSDQFATQNLRAAEANLLSLGILDLIANSSELELDPLVPKTVDSAQISEIVRIYDPFGRIIYANINVRDLPSSLRLLARHVDRGIFVIEGTNREYYNVVRSFRSPSNRVFWLQIASPRPIVNQVVKNNMIPFALMFLALLLVSFFVARFLAVQSMSPVRSIIRHIDELDFDRIKGWHPFSLREVTPDFQLFITKMNELILRSQRSLLRFHHMGRYIAHEVRTPLTIIQGEIETQLMSDLKQPEKTREILQSALQEVGRIEEIVATVLRLASRERGSDAYKPEEMDLEVFIQKQWKELQRLAGTAMLWELKAEKPLVFMDPELLSLLLSNFARNIGRHANVTASPGPVRFVVERLATQKIRLSIEDNGPGMSAELLAEANDPRSVGRRLGLGLNLCKEICNITKVDLRFENRPTGGLKILLEFFPN